MGTTIAIGSVLLVIVFVGGLAYYASRIRKVGPNKALIISGRGDDFRIIKGSRSFIWPVIERVDDLSLELMTIDVTTPDVPTIQGVPVTVEGVSQVKIGSDEVSIRTAATQFLSKTNQEIQYVAHETLAGHLRAILGTLTVEQLYKDREAFAQKVQEVSGEDMASMGIEIISFVIKDISDEEGYLEALGRPRIAQVKRDATIGEAEAERDAKIESARARQQGEAAEYQAQTRIAESEKDYKVQKAAYETEINRRNAEAELAYTIQQNIENQKVKVESVQIEVVEKQKQIEVQQQEVSRREKELEATINKPAQAEQFRVQTLAEARRFQLEAEAEGEAAAIRRRGEGEAEAIRAKGLAEAEVLRQKGLAEAEATEKKAEAWKQYTQAAIVQQILDQLPALASAMSAPLAKTDKIVMINTGGDGTGGASKITGDIANMMAQVPATIEALTGVDLFEALRNLPSLAKTEEENNQSHNES